MNWADVGVQGGFRGLEQGLRRGVRPGEGAVREVAAFLLDHEHFAGVPPTALVSCHASASPTGADGKVGSLQVRAWPWHPRLHHRAEEPFASLDIPHIVVLQICHRSV